MIKNLTLKSILPLFLISFITILFIFGYKFSADANNNLVGSIDAITERTPYGLANQRMVVTGWAKNIHNADNSLRVRVESPTIGQTVDEFTARSIRNDVPLIYGGTAETGFNWVIPARFHDGNNYEFIFLMETGDGDWHEFGRRTVEMPSLGLWGEVDFVEGKTISGWAVDMDGDDPRNQQTAILVHIDGQMVHMDLTGAYRPDVEQFFNGRGYLYTYAGEYHGFMIDNLNIPNRFRDGLGHRIQVFALEFTQGTIRQIGQTYDRVISLDGEIMPY